MEWSGQGYRSAAENHKKACDYMLKHIGKVNKNKKIIYAEIYYLSGYILECILKYFILSKKHKAQTKLSKEELEKYGLWHHNIDTLWKATELEGRWKDFPELTKNWNSEFRYKLGQVDENEFERHYKKIKDIFDKIKQTY